mmetsp:Transcript_87691/g.175424  ORF Transcript_87691/g.175424 Transcript_87691/m.175424 type:complete len:139 (-) Transcript_87691:331-747(-)
MPHGDFTDVAALSFLGVGYHLIFKQDVIFHDLGPFKPALVNVTPTPEIDVLLKIVGGLMVILGFMLFTVRWNTTNGKLSGLGCILTGALIGHSTYKIQDKEEFVLRQTYITAALLALTGLQLMLFSNPMIKAEKTKGN